jgi:hypothetical protein
MHVEPGAADDELEMLWEVEDGGDEGKTEEQEEDRVCLEREGVVSFDERGTKGGTGDGERTEDEFLNGRKDVHGHRHFELVDFELQPFAEGLDRGSHGGLTRGLLRWDDGPLCCLLSSG